MADFSPVQRLLTDAVGTVFPGACLAVIDDDDVVFQATVGLTTTDGTPVLPETVFDIASLTKVVGTTTAAMVLHGLGQLPLDTPVAQLDGFATAGGEAVTVRRLLAHACGLPAWQPFFVETRHLEPALVPSAILRRARGTELAHPPDTCSLYSDVGFIILADVMERVIAMPLDEIVARHVLEPLGMRDSFYRRIGHAAPPQYTIAPTQGGRVGEVHDNNAFALGGVAGHAGLFSTIGDLVKFALAILGTWHETSRVLDLETLRTFSAPYGLGDSTRRLGWDGVSPTGSSAGSAFGSSSIGHLGYTGCSLWIDLEAGVAVVLLSNRVHPTHTNNNIAAFRPRIHDAVRKALGR